jgi:glycosyltransferase involved in cell wall biosynthesis
MKVAVYTIAKNEEQFVEKWAESCKEADFRFILDTGSTDKTVALAQKNNVFVEIMQFNPWRFDNARNSALSFIPDDIDICIALDMDEVLLPGWREEIEKAHKDKITRPRYEYTWSWKEDGTPGLVYGGDKIHARHGYRWKHPVHEVLVSDSIETQKWYDLKIHHYPDNTKSRSQYLPLLKLSVDEDPSDDRNAHYYARELYFNGEHTQAAEEFKRHLALPSAVWKPERSTSMRYLAKCEPLNEEIWYLRAIAECPDRREALVDIAKYYLKTNQFALANGFAMKALAIINRPLEYLCEEEAWGFIPYDIAAISFFYLGDIKKAKAYGETALRINPKDERLLNNMKWYNKIGE